MHIFDEKTKDRETKYVKTMPVLIHANDFLAQASLGASTLLAHVAGGFVLKRETETERSEDQKATAEGLPVRALTFTQPSGF